MIPSRILLLAPILAATSCLPNTNVPPPTHRKMFALVEKFDRFDDNGDGYLTRRELEEGVKNAGTTPVPTQEQYDRAMVGYDTNRDGKISLREAKVAAQKGPILFEQ